MNNIAALILVALSLGATNIDSLYAEYDLFYQHNYEDILWEMNN